MRFSLRSIFLKPPQKLFTPSRARKTDPSRLPAAAAAASPLVRPGPLAPTVEDAAILLSAIAGRDKRDATSSHTPAAAYEAALPSPDSLASKPLAGVKLGLVKQTAGDGVDQGVRAAMAGAVAQLEALGATVVEARPRLSTPSLPLSLSAPPCCPQRQPHAGRTTLYLKSAGTKRHL